MSLVPKAQRVAGKKYTVEGETRIWSKHGWQCVHHRNRYYCKDCGGDGICEHNIRRNACRSCGGSQVCSHNRIRGTCADCGGSLRCEHGRVKYHCKICDGSLICEHNRAKYRCKDCGGFQFCKHNKNKRSCRECGGSALCVHGRQKSICKPCGGSSICIHNKEKRYCKDCDGSQICKHGKIKHVCTDCVTLEQALKSKRFCNICATTLISGKQRTTGMCAKCTADKPPKQQDIMWDLIRSRLPPPSIFDNQHLGGCQSSTTRPDFCWIGGDRVVHLECDENSHTDREISCELKKTDSAGWGLDPKLAHRTTIMVRFNPGLYDVRDISLADRCDKLIEQLTDLFICDLTNFSPLATNLIYMFYHTRAKSYISAARAATHTLRVVRCIE